MQHRWMLHVASVCTPCCMLLGIVAQNLKPVKLLASGKWTQQLPTLLSQQCRELWRPFAPGLRGIMTASARRWRSHVYLISTFKSPKFCLVYPFSGTFSHNPPCLCKQKGRREPQTFVENAGRVQLMHAVEANALHCSTSSHIQVSST